VTAAVRGWAGRNGIDVVIDPVGGSTMAINLDCLKPRGTVVNFGLSGGVEARVWTRSGQAGEDSLSAS
jgi:NADPH:quinone reductase-like Zn-dependent oxidoreductase